MTKLKENVSNFVIKFHVKNIFWFSIRIIPS